MGAARRGEMCGSEKSDATRSVASWKLVWGLVACTLLLSVGQRFVPTCFRRGHAHGPCSRPCAAYVNSCGRRWLDGGVSGCIPGRPGKAILWRHGDRADQVQSTVLLVACGWDTENHGSGLHCPSLLRDLRDGDLMLHAGAGVPRPTKSVAPCCRIGIPYGDPGALTWLPAAKSAGPASGSGRSVFT